MLNAKRTYLRSVAALALGLGALGVPRAALAQDAQAESGFALQASLAARFGILATIDTGSSSPTPINGTAFQAGLSAGYKTGRLYLGLGLEFNNFTFNDSRIMNPGNLVISTTTRVSDFLIGPDVQFAILRSTDNRVELIADVALHFGHRFSSVSISPSPPPGPSVPTDSNFLLSYRLGPGVRYWAHKHFAFQATTGFGGSAFFDLPAEGHIADGNNSSHGIYAAFGGMGVF